MSTHDALNTISRRKPADARLRRTDRPSTASLRRGCARPGDLGAHARIPLRQAPQDLRRHAEQADRRDRPRGSVARGDRPRVRGKGRQDEDLQQRGAGVEPRVLLALPEAGRRRRSDAARFAIRSPARSAASSSSGRTSPRRPSSNSAAAGPGSSPTAASSRSSRRRMPTCPSSPGRRRCSRSTSGSTPTISTTRTSAPTTSTR